MADDVETGDHRGSEATAEGFTRGDPVASAQVRQRVRHILAFRGFRIPHEDRLDLEQTVLLQLWQAVRRPGFDPRGFWGLVGVVTSRRCIDWLRTRPAAAPGPAGDESDPSPDPEQATLHRERADLARAVLAQLPPPCRQLIELHFVHHQTYAEMAQVLGKSRGALRVAMHRCIRRAGGILSRLRERPL